jgi:hypothetical protein
MKNTDVTNYHEVEFSQITTNANDKNPAVAQNYLFDQSYSSEYKRYEKRKKVDFCDFSLDDLEPGPSSRVTVQLCGGVHFVWGVWGWPLIEIISKNRNLILLQLAPFCVLLARLISLFNL